LGSAHLDHRISVSLCGCLLRVVWFFGFFLGSHVMLVAVSAPLMMPLRDSDIPMNVPFTFSNKQPLDCQVEYVNGFYDVFNHSIYF
jgi:hypothetical protein